MAICSNMILGKNLSKQVACCYTYLMIISMRSYCKYLKPFNQAIYVSCKQCMYVNNNRKMNYCAAYNLPRKEF